MDKILIILCALVGLGMTFFSFPEGAISVLVILVLSVPAIFFIRYYSDEKIFLTNVFLVALLLRVGLGLIIHIFNLRDTFGPDAFTYDAIGKELVDLWVNGRPTDDLFTSQPSGWGMNYLVGFIYLVCGQSMLVAQTFCAVVGAATAPMIYFCAERVFHNQRVAKVSALSIALFPSFIIWSAQLLKDGLLIFLLVLTMTMVLQLQKKFSYAAIAFLILSLLGIISLRFYIFYMVAVSVAGSFIIGLNTSIITMVRNIITIVIIGLALTYFGVIRNANTDFEKFGNLESIQYRRQALSQSADSGFGEDLDVSTPVGAISAIPVGLAYLMLAPFPWQVDKLSQALVLPETFAWWALLPILISGLWYTLKHRLRSAIPILLFSLMLTISYSIFQGNVGMAYRQRTQIQVFLFLFIAVGWTLIQERRENRKSMQIARQKQLRTKLL